MNELIKVNYDNERITTSARMLWEGLNKPYRDFNPWFNKYKEYGFTENEDYIDVTTKIVTSNGAEHDAIDYQITLDMAKQLAMLQKSEKGMKYRQYFIDLEKKFKEKIKLQNEKANCLLALYDGGINAIEASKRLTEIEMQPILEENTTLKKKETAYTALLDYSKYYSMSDVAKFFGYGRNKLFELLRQLKHLNLNNAPSQYCINQDYMVYKNVPVRIGNKTEYKMQTFITNTGLDFIAKTLYKNNIISIMPSENDMQLFKDNNAQYLK